MGARFIKYLIQSVLNTIYSGSENCIICGTYSAEEELICKSCLNKIELCNSSFIINKEGIKIKCYSAAYYKTTAAELIKRLKYKCDFNCGIVLSNLLINLIKLKNVNYDIITYVPMNKKALRKRGFNQSKFLAKCISESFNKPVKECIIKVKPTKDQIGLDQTSRFDNLMNSFKIYDRTVIENKKVLLVDDVITTGATAFYCCKELLNNGAEKVTILTAAKSKL